METTALAYWPHHHPRRERDVGHVLLHICATDGRAGIHIRSSRALLGRAAGAERELDSHQRAVALIPAGRDPR